MTTRITLTLEMESVAKVKQIATKRNISVSKVVDDLLHQFSDVRTQGKNPEELLGILNPDKRNITEKEIDDARWKALKNSNGL